MDGTDDLNLDRQLRERLEALSRRLNASVADVIRRALDAFERPEKPSPPTDSRPPGRSLYDAFEERGLVGCIDGPTDLSTNPKYLEGLGRD